MTSGSVSALQDESSMPSLVLAGLQSVYKLTARKHKQLRQECEEIIQSLQRDDEEQRAALLQQQPTASALPADTDADKYFLPFKLACESDNSRMQAVALNQIEKLIAYGYLDGASVADPTVYPPRKSDAATAEGVGGRPTALTAAAVAALPTATAVGPATDGKGGRDRSDRERSAGPVPTGRGQH